MLRRSPGDAAVQLEGLQYLADLSHSPEGVQHAVAAAAIEAVVAAMKAHASHAGIQNSGGCWALGRILKAAENQLKVAAAGGIEAAVAAMKAHAGEDINVQRSGCVTLSSIATATEGKGGGCGRHRGSFGRYEGMHRRH